MARVSPLVAVIGLPGLITPLAAAGYTLLTPSTSRPVVVTAISDATARGRRVVVIATAPATNAQREWTAALAAAGGHALVVTSPVLGYSPAIEGTRSIALPATVNEMMACFLAPPVPAGEVLIDASGEVARGSGPGSGDDARFVDPAVDDVDLSDLDLDDPDPTFPHLDDPTADDLNPDLAGPGAGRAQASAPMVIDVTRDDPPGATAGPLATLPAVVRPVLAPAQGVPDLAVRFDDRPLPPSSGIETRERGTLCPVVVSFAAKGGVGKTTMAFALAERAQETRSEPGRAFKVVLVDANSGQSGVQLFLRLQPTARVRTIADYAGTSDYRSALMSPKQLTDARPRQLPPVAFGAIFAPRRSDRHPAGAQVYRDVIAAARQYADLVVIDTQIIGTSQIGPLWSQWLLPLLKDPSCWGIGLTDTSIESTQHLAHGLRTFAEEGIPRDRVFIAGSRWQRGSHVDVTGLEGFYSQYGTWAGIIAQNPRLAAQLELGSFASADPGVRRIVDTVLDRALGEPPRAAAPATGIRLPWRSRSGRWSA